MATTVIYNDVTMHNVLTERWDQESVYDQSGTDLIGQKFSFRFRGVLHAQRAPIAASRVYIDTPGTTPTVFTLLDSVSKALALPRRRLQVKIDANTVVDIAPVAGTVHVADGDVNNGPKPKHVEVTPVGSSAFRVVFEIEAETSNCNRSRSGSDIVLNNRWRLTETMDENYFTTRLISGTMRLSRSFSPGTQGPPAHLFKHIVIPPLEDSFKRDRIAFTVQEDGLTCLYEVLDRQIHTAAPWPATRMNASYSESTAYGTDFVSDMRVTLEGDPGVDKRLLVERAIQILDVRLGLLELDTAALIQSLIVGEEIGEKATVMASASVRRVHGIARLALGILLQKVGTKFSLPPLSNANGVIDGTNYDNQLSRVPKTYGYKASSREPDWERNPAATMLLHCYLQSPCDTEHQVGPLNTSGTSTSQSQSSRYPHTEVTEVPYTQPIADEFNSFSQATAQGIYTVAEVTSRYHANRMLTQMPIANVPSNGPTSEILQLAGAQYFRYIEVNLERANAEPAIPNPVDTYEFRGVSARLKAFDVEILAPIRSPDGRQRIERRIAKYLYLLDRPVDFTKSLPVGVNPVTNFPGFDGTVSLDRSGDMGIGASSGSFTPG